MNPNNIQLITYPNSLGRNLKDLMQVLNHPLSKAFDVVHLLPPYPSSGDRGFAPLTYLEIEPSFGDWEQVKALGARTPLMLDVMVNHLSAQSNFFQDVLQKGEHSPYYEMFLPLPQKRSFPSVMEQDLIFRRRSKPYSTYAIGETTQSFWTTFGKEDPSEQVDLDIASSKVNDLFETIFETFHQNNIAYVRLDAIGYVIKKKKTSCFFVEPEIDAFLTKMQALARKHHIELLPELHASFQTQQKLSAKGFWIYDFILPYRILEALLLKEADALVDYLRTRPSRQITMLDCHDGVPVKPDLEGMLDPKKHELVKAACLKQGCTVSKIYSKQHIGRDGIDDHQIRGTYFSMLQQDENAMMVARAIQLFTPGVPQVYYAGLFADGNDLDAIQQQQDERASNRHNYTREELEVRWTQPFTKRMLALVEWRNHFPVFDGTFTLLSADSTHFTMRWEKKAQGCELQVDLNRMQASIQTWEALEQTAFWWV
ncbi:MAG: sucrose phosphorylase [Erysipelotrichaceae bacterium]